ncbi:ABC transporter permease [Streptomyces sp. NPDC058299]|uniref:ABC transporter permease n=1 Tax=unclassified Streptomyces TaxID=2593676 RepID=UPI0036F1188D
MMPVNMLLFFGYVFGSALAMPGREYRSFLVPGLLVATAAGGLMTGMFQAAQDTHRGVTDRFRTMPVSRAAVPLGQAVADLVVTTAGTVPPLLVGLAVGWRIEGSAPGAAGAVGLLLLFRFACTRAGIFLGLLTRSEEAAGQLGAASFVLPLPSDAYIPADNLPGWPRTLAEWNPISAVTTALRELFGNAPVPDGAAWPVAHPVAGALAWSLALTALFLPLAVRRYARGE